MFWPLVYVSDCAPIRTPTADKAMTAAITHLIFSLLFISDAFSDVPNLLRLVLTLVLRRASRRRGSFDRAQRASDDIVVSRQVQFAAAARHLLAELLFAHRDALAEVDEHVRHRTVSRPLPVARIGHVLVR